MISSPSRPSQRALERLVRAIVRGGMLEALVEHHRNIRSQLRLNIYRRFRCQQMLAAVEMRAERRPLLVHLTPRREAEDLIPAAVGEDGLVPSDERVETTERSDRKSTRLNSSHLVISYAVFCLNK